MKKVGNKILLVGAIGIWVIIILFFSLEKNNSDMQEKPQFLFINNFFFWKYEDGEWENLDTYEDNELFNWKKFDVYLNNTYDTTYSYVYNKGFGYFFDDDYQSIQVSGDDLLLLNHNSYINLIKYSLMDLDEDDEKYLSKIINKNDLDKELVTTKLKYKISDNNYLYVISNSSDDTYDDDTFSLFVYKTRFRSYVIDMIMHDYELSLQSIIDVGEKNPNFLIKYQCHVGYCYDMYQYKDKEYKVVAGLNISE